MKWRNQRRCLRKKNNCLLAAQVTKMYVRLSVCHTRESRLDDSRYRNMLYTVQ